MTKMMIGGVDMWGNMLATQNLTDQLILRKKSLKMEELMDEKVLALSDELMEYAKETKCFKYWSEKEASDHPVRLEEFIDGVHFYLSFFMDFGINAHEIMEYMPSAGIPAAPKDKKKNLTQYIRKAMQHINKMEFVKGNRQSNKLHLLTSFSYFMHAGRLDGFTDQMIEKAYYEKNAENHKRQKSGY